MNGTLIHTILAAIAVTYPFSEKEVEACYNTTKSLDLTIGLCAIAAATGMDLGRAYSYFVEAGLIK